MNLEKASPLEQTVEAHFCQAHPNHRQRILLVDGDSDLCHFNAEVLRHSGYEVDAVEDGAGAWDALQLHRYDLLIIDNGNSKVTGVDLLRKIYAACIVLPTILAAGTLPPRQFVERASLQIEAALPKPYHFEDLLIMVKNVLRKTTDACGAAASPPNWSSQPLPARFRIA
jgi:DNA-binding response OmpR family regulator